MFCRCQRPIHKMGHVPLHLTHQCNSVNGDSLALVPITTPAANANFGTLREDSTEWWLLPSHLTLRYSLSSTTRLMQMRHRLPIQMQPAKLCYQLNSLNRKSPFCAVCFPCCYSTTLLSTVTLYCSWHQGLHRWSLLSASFTFA